MLQWQHGIPKTEDEEKRRCLGQRPGICRKWLSSCNELPHKDQESIPFLQIHNNLAGWLVWEFIAGRALQLLGSFYFVMKIREQARKHYHVSCRSKIQLYRRHATGQVVTGADELDPNCKQALFAPSDVCQNMWHRQVLCGCFYSKQTLRSILAEGIYFSIRISMCYVWADNPEATLEDLARYA